MKTTEIAVEFQNVTKAFGDVQAVQNLNFSIDPVSYTHLTLPTKA